MNATVEAICDLVDPVKANDLTDLEAMLAAQAVQSNAIATWSFRVAKYFLGNGDSFTSAQLDVGERFMKLGFRGMSQCRAHVETLAQMKNPTARSSADK